MVKTNFRRRWAQFRRALDDAVIYRYSYQALLFDALVATVRPPRRPFQASRYGPGLFFVALLALPAYGIGVGYDQLGDTRAFAVGGLVLALALEWPGRTRRTRVTNPTYGLTSPASRKPGALIAVGSAEFLFPLLLSLTPESLDATLRGLLWGVAIAGTTDLARTAAALYLADHSGSPLYPRFYRIPAAFERQQNSLMYLATLVHRKSQADKFAEDARKRGLDFAAVRIDDPAKIDSLTLIYDGGDLWIGDDYKLVPREILGP